MKGKPLLIRIRPSPRFGEGVWGWGPPLGTAALPLLPRRAKGRRAKSSQSKV
jgi:hypothetical protein